MKTDFLSIALLAALASAAPHEIQVRQSNRVGSTANEFKEDGCKPVVMLFARGSTEAGNMVSISLLSMAITN